MNYLTLCHWKINQIYTTQWESLRQNTNALMMPSYITIQPFTSIQIIRKRFIAAGGVYYDKKEYKRAIEDRTRAIEIYEGIKSKEEWSLEARTISTKPKGSTKPTLNVPHCLTYIAAYNNRGYGYYSNKEYQKAIDDFMFVINSGNGSVRKLHCMIGQCYELLGNKELARKEYDEFLEDMCSYESIQNPQTLFRFLPMDDKRAERNLKSLKEQTLFLAEASSWNDPFDCNFSIKNTPIFKGKLQFLRMQCFVEGGAGEVLAVKNLLMWSHYASSHSGICIEYEYTPQKNTVDNGGLYKVSYGVNATFDINGVHTYFATKSTQWAYEKEYRICYWNTENKPSYAVTKKYDELGLKIKRIYIGVKFNEKYIEKIKQIGKDLNCEIWQVKTKDEHFQLEHRQLCLDNSKFPNLTCLKS